MQSRLDHDAGQNTNDNASAQEGRPDRRTRVRQLNDALRRSGQGGRVLLTASVAALPPEQQAAMLYAVADFDEFDDGNSPYDEHDCGLLDVDGRLVGFRIDYYRLDLVSHSPDPSDPAATARVLTIWTPEDA